MTLPTIDDAVRAMYPALRRLHLVAAKDAGIDLPETFDECDEEDRKYLRDITRAAIKANGFTDRFVDTESEVTP